MKVVLDWYEGAQKVDLSDYVPSGTWDVVECPGKLENKRDPGEQHNRSQITYTLKIRRKTLFYTVNLIIPCVLISLLSVSVFYLPADAGEKMTMCISILLPSSSPRTVNHTFVSCKARPLPSQSFLHPLLHAQSTTPLAHTRFVVYHLNPSSILSSTHSQPHLCLMLCS